MQSTVRLRIRRFLEGNQAVVGTECAAGTITVFCDNGDGHLKTYHDAIAGLKTHERISLDLDGKDFEAREALSVGFNDCFPDGSRIDGYLASLGLSSDEATQVIRDFELEKHTYLMCSQLPATASRQLVLFSSLRNVEEPVFFLNDPFLPFNGRWREVFAEKLLEDTVTHNRITVIVNLSFVPKVWNGKQKIVFVNVADAADLALKRALEQKARELARQQSQSKESQVEQPIKEKKAEVSPAAKAVSLEAQILADKKPVFVLPENVRFAYREARDLIFEPLANISSFLRSYSGPVAIGSCAFLVLIMAFVMFPNLQAGRTKLRELGAMTSYTWRDFIPSFTRDESAPPEPHGEQQAALNKESVEVNVSDKIENPGQLSETSEHEIKVQEEIPAEASPDVAPVLVPALEESERNDLMGIELMLDGPLALCGPHSNWDALLESEELP